MTTAIAITATVLAAPAVALAAVRAYIADAHTRRAHKTPNFPFMLRIRRDESE